MMTPRAKRIQNVIAKRAPQIEALESSKAGLGALSFALQELERKRSDLGAELERDPSQPSLACLYDLNFEHLQKKVEAEQGRLQQLIGRFSRQTLNIGVVGRAGQGKSRLLQSLTGLSPYEIPDGRLNNCTGIQSTITHVSNIDPYAYIHFHSEQSFLEEVIYPFFEFLDLGSKPFSINEFAQPLSSLPGHLANNAMKVAIYDRLYRYHDHLAEYQALLNRQQPQHITNREEIRQFVSQTNLQGEPVYFNFLAVKKAEIFAAFPQNDIGQIALIDLPGLGDTTLGDEQKLREATKHDFDFIIFVYKPSERTWQEEQIDLYETARSASEIVPIDQWSFLVLNRTRGSEHFADNLESCQVAQEQLQAKGIRVSHCLIKDCADKGEAAEVLDNVINYLDQNIECLDNLYLSETRTRLADLQAEVAGVLSQANHCIQPVMPNDAVDFSRFLVLFQQIWDYLNRDLKNLLTDLSHMRYSGDPGFRAAIEAILEKCRNNTGDINLDANDPKALREIAQISLTQGSYPQGYFHCMHLLRTHIAYELDALDLALKNSIIEVKTQVANILMNPDGIRLSSLTEKTGAEFLQTMAEQVPDFADQDLRGAVPKLKQGFESLASFDISYRGLVKHRVRRQLDKLTPDENTVIPFEDADPAERRQRKILEYLSVLYQQSIDDFIRAFQDLLSEPNEAAFAMAEDFVDQALRSKNAQLEWQLFLFPLRSQIWPDEFGQIAAQRQQQQEWSNLLQRAATANQLQF